MTSQTVRLRVFASLSLRTLHARICLLASRCLSNSLNLHFEFYSDCYIDTAILLLYCCLWRPILMHMLLFYFYIDACNNRSSCSSLVLNRWVYMIHVGTLLVFSHWPCKWTASNTNVSSINRLIRCLCKCRCSWKRRCNLPPDQPAEPSHLPVYAAPVVLLGQRYVICCYSTCILLLVTTVPPARACYWIGECIWSMLERCSVL